MSVRNIFVSEERILCLTDTMIYSGGKPLGLVTAKCGLTINEQVAFASRGAAWFGIVAATAMADCACFDDFTDGLEALASAVKADPACLQASVGELTYMGWSDAQQRLCAVVVQFPQDGGGAYEAKELPPGLHLAPGVPGAKLPATVTDDIMVKVALAQQKVATHFKLPACIGGIMHLTTVTKEGAARRMVGAYPDFEEHARTLPNSASNVEEYRAFCDDQAFMSEVLP